MDELGIDSAEYSSKVVNRMRVVGAIRSLVNARICSLSLLVLHEILIVPVLMYRVRKVFEDTFFSYTKTIFLNKYSNAIVLLNSFRGKN